MFFIVSFFSQRETFGEMIFRFVCWIFCLFPEGFLCFCFVANFEGWEREHILWLYTFIIGDSVLPIYSRKYRSTSLLSYTTDEKEGSKVISEILSELLSYSCVNRRCCKTRYKDPTSKCCVEMLLHRVLRGISNVTYLTWGRPFFLYYWHMSQQLTVVDPPPCLGAVFGLL